MEFNLFIVPATLIVVQMLKRFKALNNDILPLIAVGLGVLMGAGYGIYYGADLFVHIFLGGVYGASASGLYDAGKTTKTEVMG